MSEPPPKILIAEQAIAQKVEQLAAQISRDHAGVESLLLVGVLKGSFIFLADLSRRLSIDRTVDFIALSSYGASARPTGEVRLVMDLRTTIAGKHVLIVEDIVDTGRTLEYLMRLLKARGPASLGACVLVRKPRGRQAGLELAYLGFDIPDKWVVGYGLDVGERFRTLPYIGYVDVPPAP